MSYYVDGHGDVFEVQDDGNKLALITIHAQAEQIAVLKAENDRLRDALKHIEQRDWNWIGNSSKHFGWAGLYAKEVLSKGNVK